MNTRWWVVLLSLSVAALVAGVSNGIAAAAQDGGESHVFEMTDSTVEVRAPWRVEQALSFKDEAVEVLGLASTNQNLLIGVVPSSDPDPIARVLGDHAPSFEQIVEVDRRSGGGVTEVTQLANIDGVEYAILADLYTERHPGVIEVYYYIAPRSTMGAGFDLMTRQVRVDGQSVFYGIDGMETQSWLSAWAGDSGGSSDAATDRELPPPLAAPNDTGTPVSSPVPLPATPVEERATPDPSA